MITRSDVKRELGKMGSGLGNGQGSLEEAHDEEAEMAMLMDEKLGAE